MKCNTCKVGIISPDDLICLNSKCPTNQDQNTLEGSGFNKSGSKYLREMKFLVEGKFTDVYGVLLAFNVICPARGHAIKKLLCSGVRGKGDAIQDLEEARDAITRAIEIEEMNK